MDEPAADAHSLAQVFPRLGETGTAAEINTTLAASSNVVYRGAQDYNGSDTLSVVTDDAGNTGSGGAKSDTDTVAITINAVNDTPVNTVPGAQTVNEDTNLSITGLSVSDADDSMTFAGDIPEGAFARLMRANFDRLIDGAGGAARISAGAIGDRPAELALLISCVGRKMVLKQRIEEEVEGVRDVVGPGTVLTGFYSYGEISPFMPGAKCELHNQTMTITTLSEA